MHVYASPIAPNELYSQAYWSAVIAAILYFILSTILIINMLGYFLGHYPQHFALSDGQRTLILQTLSFVIWLLIGAVIFSRVIDISFADALYFSDVTILTVGFGDIAPTNSVGRGVLFPYAVMGIIMLGLVVGSIHQFAKELQYDNVIRKHVERKRLATIRRATTLENNHSGPAENGTHASDSDEAAQIGYRPAYSRDHPIISSISSWTQGLAGRSKLLLMKEEKDRFDAMRAIQNETIIFRRTYNLSLSILLFGIVWTIGAVVFWQLEENLSYFDALYFGFCALLTVGYGDFSPTTNAAKPFFVVWSLIAVPTMTTLISEMSDTIVAWFKHATDKVADWTVLPQSSKYKAFLEKLPVIYSALERRAEKKRVAQGFPVGDLEPGQRQDDGATRHPRPLEDLARDASPSRQDLAQQLAFAIRRTAKHALAGHPKHYTYEEWVEFTRLIRFTDNSPDGVVLDEDEFGVLNWDWIGETSPMLASQSEPAWVLERLCESLIRYVDGESRRQPSDQDEKPLNRTNGDRDDEEPTLKKERDIRFEDD
jgi:potassium channel subfamily K